MTDMQDKDKNQQQGQHQSGNQPEKTGQQPQQQKTPQEDSSKKNPSQGGQDEEKDRTGQRRAS